MVDTVRSYDTSRHYINPVLNHATYDLTTVPAVRDCIVHNQLDTTIDGWCIDKIIDLLNQCTTHYIKHITSSSKSLYTGALALPGLTYIVYKSNTYTSDSKADELLQLANQYADTLVQQLPAHTLNTPHTLIIGDTAIVAVTVILKSLARKQYDTVLQQLLNLKQHALISDTDELLYGKSGFVQMLLFVLHNAILTDQQQQAVQDTISAVLDRTIQDGRETRRHDTNSALMWQWHNKFYLGAAHGLAGILTTILRCRWYVIDTNTSNQIKQTIDYCITQRYSSGNYKSSVDSTTDRLVQWCHGAPGLALLCIEAYKYYRDDQYLNTAIQQSDIIWQRGLLRKGDGLCHGISGNAIVFMHLYNITSNIVHLRRAEYFMNFALNSEYTAALLSQPDHPYSMYEGMGGAVLAMCDLIGVRQQKLHYKMQATDYGL